MPKKSSRCTEQLSRKRKKELEETQHPTTEAIELPTQSPQNVKAEAVARKQRRTSACHQPGLVERHYSNVDIHPLGHSVDVYLLRNELLQSVFERYAKMLYINNGRYCFCDDVASITEETLFPLSTFDMVDYIARGGDHAKLSISQYENVWMNLNKKGKADLCRIMNTPVYLWHMLKFDEMQKTWIKRANDGDTTCVMLSDYGEPDDSFTCFTERLSTGLTPLEMVPLEHTKLVQHWSSALQTGMANGEGSTAVFQLFEDLVDLLPQMNISTPVQIFQKTCASKYDCCCMPDFCSTSTTSIKRLSELVKREGYARSDGILMTPHKHLPDMVVLSRDEESGLAKYLAVIDIQTEGNDIVKAQEKFKKDVLSTLQAQDAVFGFLFSASGVMYYYAKKEVTGEINIEQFKYPIAKPELNQNSQVHVGVFQMLIMDFLASLVFGLHTINIS